MSQPGVLRSAARGCESSYRFRDVVLREVVRLRAPLVFRAVVVLRAFVVLRVRVPDSPRAAGAVRRGRALFFDAVPLAPTRFVSRGISGSASNASSAADEIRLVPPCTWRCNVPITRPSDSAERSNSESASFIRSALRSGSPFVPRLAIPSSSLGPQPSRMTTSRLMPDDATRRWRRLWALASGFGGSGPVTGPKAANARCLMPNVYSVGAFSFSHAAKSASD
jgi:hypothetical protein